MYVYNKIHVEIKRFSTYFQYFSIEDIEYEKKY
nr:MAG TPA: hypothetical protein [Caudoviricetes sp.]